MTVTSLLFASLEVSCARARARMLFPLESDHIDRPSVHRRRGGSHVMVTEYICISDVEFSLMANDDREKDNDFSWRRPSAHVSSAYRWPWNSVVCASAMFVLFVRVTASTELSDIRTCSLDKTCIVSTSKREKIARMRRTATEALTTRKKMKMKK